MKPANDQRPILTVSRRTQNFVECLESMQTLYSQISSSLEYAYGERNSDDKMHDKFWEKYDELWNIVQGFMAASITEHIGDVDFKEI